MGNEVNIKSSTLEKGLELAKDFVSKLIGPTIEEFGLLLADNIKYFRFRNQVKILLKSRKYVESRKINIKQIPTKILVPLLEQASLEEDEELQDKWAKMIVNMSDSETNLVSNIFPYILSQISKEEFNELNELNKSEKSFNEKYFSQSDIFIEINQSEIDLINQEGFMVSLEAYEIENLIRLGLMKELPPPVEIEEFKTNDPLELPSFSAKWHKLRAKYNVGENGYRITELGELFLDICQFPND